MSMSMPIMGTKRKRNLCPPWRLDHEREIAPCARVANNLKSLRNARGWSQDEMARRMGTTRNQITKLEGGNRRMSDVWIGRAAKAFDVDPGALVSNTQAEMSVVPLVSWVAAGQLATVESVPDGEEAEKVVTTNLPPGRWIVLRVEGDSMNLVAPDGSKIFVNREEVELKSGQYYVVGFDDGSATFKRFRSSPSRFEPMSTNNEHDTIFPRSGERVTVVGRVRKIVHDLD